MVYTVGMPSNARLHQTSAILVIGNEVLSGRTREANAYLAAEKMFERGCKLSEIVVVPDVKNDITHTLNRLRYRYDAVITSGGIGPTHDDITMEAIAESFGVLLLEHEATLRQLHARYGDRLNVGRRRMARLPETAEPILCEASFMPGAHIGNVYVLAGVPTIFASQLETFLDDFGGIPYIRHEIGVVLAESLFAKELSDIQAQFPSVEIGSYPKVCGDKPCGKICLSAQHDGALRAAKETVLTMLQNIHANQK
ncbi:MAG: molybdopterin-binding protein [Mariprofundaceae bacterium]|nr:molybdopterin-binding protein [Mariprofundaceae bacterium]